MQNYHAIIFDCDGVLVNSEEIIQDIELALLAEHGLEYEREAFGRRFLGVANDHFYEQLNADSMERLGKPLSPDFPAQLKERGQSQFTERLRAFDGIFELTSAWAKPYAVASSSTIQGLEFKLNHTGLADLFYPHVYSAEHVGKGKPHPDIYLHAAAGLNVEPTLCIAVEDSINGVKSACAAGMFTVGFTGGGHCLPGHEDDLSGAGADVVVENLIEIIDHLQLG